MNLASLSLLICPLCGHKLRLSEAGIVCPADGSAFPRHASGLLDLRTPAHRERADAFAASYRAARLADGWQPLAAEAARVLPEGEPAGFTRLYWQVRRESWLAVRQILAEFQHRPDDRGADSLLLADAGAGFPWLSHRLAALGYCVVAFDLSGDPDFGLGAARFYEDALGWLSVADNAIVAPGQFLPVLGSLDEPPLAPNRFDAIFCNASLHYVNDLHGCITQLARSLQANGALVIMDSPVAERGQRDDHAGGRILGRQELNQACQVAGLRPEWRSVQRGWLWRRHQLKNWLLRRRRFDFPILIGHKGPGQENERPDAPI